MKLPVDEGDALLTQRTSLRISNDRYSNPETNFLFRWLECLPCIVIITTKPGDPMDHALQR